WRERSAEAGVCRGSDRRLAFPAMAREVAGGLSNGGGRHRNDPVYHDRRIPRRGLWPGLEQQDSSGTIRGVRRGNGQHPQFGNEKAGACPWSRWQVSEARWFLRRVGNLENVHETLSANDVHAPELRVIEQVVGVADACGMEKEIAGAAVVNGQSRGLAASDKEPC